MGYGTSLGTSHEDEMSYVLEKGLTDKQLSDQKEMATNQTSGDFQSRFSASDTSTMPLEASKKLTDALKRTGSTEVPEKVPETNFLGRLSIVNAVKGMNAGATDAVTNFPENFKKGLMDMVSLVKAPGDAMSGKLPIWAVDPETGDVSTSTQTIEKAANLAAAMVGMPAPVAGKLVDGSLGSFAGVKSKALGSTNMVRSDSLKGKLYEAQEMSLDMIHPDEIWDKTGWFKGADNRWRYEIPDKDAKLKMDAFDTIIEHPNKNMEATGGGWTSINNRTPQWDKIVPKILKGGAGDPLSLFLGEGPKKSLTLDKVLDHPELFKAYPELGTMKVEPLPEYLQKTGIKGQVSGNTIYLAPGPPEYVRSVLLHEIQHGIQHHEGFAFGGNSEQFLPKELPQAIKEFLAIKKSEEPKIAEVMGSERALKSFKQAINAEQEGWLIDPALKDAKAQLDRLKEEFPGVYKKLTNIVKSERLIEQAREEAHTKYTRLMGEVEARNVQARSRFTEWERAIHPRGTEDTPRHLQIPK